LNGTADEKIRVLVIGESPIVRAGLAAAISESDRFEVVGTSSLAGSAALFESTAASAVLMESGTFSSGIPKPPSVALTPREIEVLRLLADGASNKLIAHKLGISDQHRQIPRDLDPVEVERRHADGSSHAGHPHGLGLLVSRVGTRGFSRVRPHCGRRNRPP
jgi:hypothetical protein